MSKKSHYAKFYYYKIVHAKHTFNKVYSKMSIVNINSIDKHVSFNGIVYYSVNIPLTKTLHGFKHFLVERIGVFHFRLAMYY